jgi:hypothetical protein
MTTLKLATNFRNKIAFRKNLSIPPCFRIIFTRLGVTSTTLGTIPAVPNPNSRRQPPKLESQLQVVSEDLYEYGCQGIHSD